MLRRSPWRRRLLPALLLLVLLVLWCTRARPLVLGTFNIRTFPGDTTDLDAVADALAGLDADAVAVQEIRTPAALTEVLARASARSGRRYVATLAPSCRSGGERGRLSVGVVYDADRLELLASRTLSPGDSCPEGQAPAMVALLAAGERRLALASVHLQWGGREADVAVRIAQWRWLTALLPDLGAELGAPVVVGGDFNSTDYLDEDSVERRFIDATLARHDLQLPTGALACSMYWQPKQKQPRHIANLLDHVLAPSDLSFGTPEALGMCAALACAPHDGPPPGFAEVSDHCPVRVTLR